MKNIPAHFYKVYKQAISDYHVFDDVDHALDNAFGPGTIEHIAYEKSWIDTVQWHLEDLIRDPAIESLAALRIKKRIDQLNQKRTDIVELIDDYFQRKYKGVPCQMNARHNTESLGWALDRLSILALKEYHIDIELGRQNATEAHLAKCMNRKNILLSQKDDLLQSINWLIEDIEQGRKINKVYRQLKMYNDVEFNPVLYKKLG
ncbi:MULTISPECIES: DUF4254 domain-containing protein [Niastella]|uniref:DUF4254 domain-containing protein n=1 Tax=Niastella soli TaxID=2821487 RepID=A0ABS3YUL2_9BACT|nr:DUF4254 domain-containing protein [Niastella soli]MBO9201558.1 DUF4254 domain-containing protein [Niastella soli]